MRWMMLALLVLAGCSTPQEASGPKTAPAPAATETAPAQPAANAVEKPVEKPVEPTPAAAPEKGVTPAATARSGAPGFESHRPVVHDLALAARLPASALGVAAIASPTAVAQRIGWVGLLDALGPEMNEIRAGMKAEVGHDLLDPTTWSQLGIDTARPVGLAVLDVRPITLAVGFELTDREKLRTWLFARTVGRTGIEEKVEGDLTLLSVERLTLALQGKEAWLIVGEGFMPGESLHYARSLAAPENRLMALPQPGEVLAALDYGRDAAAYLHVPGAIDTVMRAALGDHRLSFLERQLRAAKALGDADAVAAAQAELDAGRKDGMERQMATMAAGVMLRSYLTPFGGIAAGAQFETDGIRVRLEQAIGDGSPVSRIMRSRAGTLPLAGAFDRAPIGLAEVVLDPEAVYETLALVALPLTGARGLGMMEEEMKREIGIAPKADLLPLLAGDLGIAVGIDPAKAAGASSQSEVVRALEIAGHIGLKDPDATRALFDRLVELSRGEIARTADRWSIAWDDGIVLSWRIVDQQVRFVTDVAMFDRWKAGPGFTAKVAPPPLAAMVSGESGGSVLWGDVAALGPLMLDRAPRVVRETDAPPDSIEAKLAAIDRKIEEAQARHRALQQQQGRAMLAAIGRAALVIEPTAAGLSMRGGVFAGGGDLPRAVSEVGRLFVANDESVRALWTETLDPLYAERRALFEAQRQRDAAQKGDPR